VVVAAVVLLLAVAGLAVAALAAGFARGGTIAPHVSVAGVAVGGMSADQAQAALERSLLPLTQTEVELAYPGGSVKLTREQLGLSFDLGTAVNSALAVGREPGLLARIATHWRLRSRGVDLPAPLSVDQPRLEAAVAALAPRVNREPRDAKISVNGSNTLDKTPGQTGLVLLVKQSAAALARDLQDLHTTRVDLAVKQKPPNISAEDLAGLQMVLAAYSTPYHTWQTDRTHNMALAIGKVNGTALKPGQEFSLNGTVGERTVEEGYRSAPIFKEGRVVPDTGGGICQVASTLYNVALLANLDVLERDHHSRPVWYCPMGRDATVYWGQHDLRLRNSLQHTIVILGEIRGDRLWAAVVGSAADDYDVELTVTNKATWGAGTQTIEDPSLPVGERVVENPGCGGARATLWMTVSKDGKQIKKVKLHDDTYEAQTRVVRIGVKPKAPPPPGAPPAGEEEPGTAPGPGLAPAPGSRPSPGAKPAANGKPKPGASAAGTRPAVAHPRPRPAAVPAAVRGG
jgi:vancomycin resistance protein YoaR